MKNGRVNDLEYGPYAPDAPNVFIDENKFTSVVGQESRADTFLTYGTDVPHLEQLVGRQNLHVAAESGNYLLTNQALP